MEHNILFDDFEKKSENWIYRIDNKAGFSTKNSNLVFSMGPTEGDLYYSNAELSDGTFEDLKWQFKRAEFKVKFDFNHYGSAGWGFWNYSMVTDLSMPIWFIYLNSRGKYPLKGFFLQVVNQFYPVKLMGSKGLGAVSMISRLFPKLVGVNVLSSKPLMQNLDISVPHSYTVDWKENKAGFYIDDKFLIDIPFVYKYDKKARLDVWIDNSVFVQNKNDPSMLYKHSPQENREKYELFLDYIKVKA